MVAVIRMALLKPAASDGVQMMVKALLSSLDKRFQFVIGEKQLMVATLLDPRFKDRFMPPEVRQCVYEWLIDEVMSRNEDHNEIPAKRVAVAAPQLPQSSSVWEAFDEVIHGSQTPTADAPVSDSAVANRASVMQMIRVYVTEPTINRMSDPLKWWADTNGFQDLAPVARQFLCPPPTSVPSERLFSGAGLIYSDHRSRLAAEKAEKLMFIRTNLVACN